MKYYEEHPINRNIQDNLKHRLVDVLKPTDSYFYKHQKNDKLKQLKKNRGGLLMLNNPQPFSTMNKKHKLITKSVDITNYNPKTSFISYHNTRLLEIKGRTNQHNLILKLNSVKPKINSKTNSPKVNGLINNRRNKSTNRIISYHGILKRKTNELLDPNILALANIEMNNFGDTIFDRLHNTSTLSLSKRVKLNKTFTKLKI